MVLCSLPRALGVYEIDSRLDGTVGALMFGILTPVDSLRIAW